MFTPSSTQTRSNRSELVRHRSEQRHDDERQLEEIEEKSEEENQDVHHDQEADCAARESREQVLDPEDRR